MIMAKIKCLVCGEVIEAVESNVTAMCGCANAAYVSDDLYVAVGAEDINKISIFRESTGKFESLTM